MGKRESNKALRTEKMIMAAIEVFKEKGIEAAKMTDIAEKSGIGVASLYRYFKTKGDIALEVGIKYWEQANQHIEDTIDVTASGLDNLVAIIKIYQEEDGGINDFYRFIEQLDHYIIKLQDKPERLRAYETTIEERLPKYKRLLEQGKADGSIHESVDINKALYMMNHTLMALKQKYCSRGLIISSDSIQAQSEEMNLLIDIFTSYFKNGLF